MMSKSSTAYFWRQWNLGTDFVVPLTIYHKLVTPTGATVDPFGPPISCPICRKRNANFDEVMKYGSMIDMSRSRIFEIPDGPVGSEAAHSAASGTPPRGPALTVVSVAGAPGAGTGSNGNYAFDTTNLRLYGPKASGAWPSTYSSLMAKNESVVKEADGTLWTVQRINWTIFDNLQVLICIPEI